MSARQVRVLLTGGIGAGKSAVGELLRARGALVIDADEVGHRVLEPGGEAFGSVAEAWPSVVVDGMIDRRLLAAMVFADPVELVRLEDLTHAAIRRRIAGTIERSAEQVVVVEVPLLTDFMGSGWLRVVVDADPDTRLERLLARGMEEDDVARRMAVQPQRSEWTAAADMLIDNSGDAASLDAQVDALWDGLTSRFPQSAEDPADP